MQEERLQQERLCILEFVYCINISTFQGVTWLPVSSAFHSITLSCYSCRKECMWNVNSRNGSVFWILFLLSTFPLFKGLRGCSSPLLFIQSPFHRYSLKEKCRRNVYSRTGIVVSCMYFLYLHSHGSKWIQVSICSILSCSGFVSCVLYFASSFLRLLVCVVKHEKHLHRYSCILGFTVTAGWSTKAASQNYISHHMNEINENG